MKWIVVVLFAIAAVVGAVSGCGRNDSSPDGTSNQQSVEPSSESEVAVSEEQSASIVPEIPEPIIGVAPFDYSASIPNALDLPVDEWYCEWTSGDGSRHIGSTFKHRYESPGDFVVTWTVHSEDTVLASGSQRIQTLQIIDVRPTRDSSDLLETAEFWRYQLSDQALEGSLVLPHRSGLALISSNGQTVLGNLRFSYGAYPVPYANAPMYVYSHDDDKVYAFRKSDGATAFEVDVNQLLPYNARISAIAYSASQSGVFVLAYPRGEEKVTGHCFFIQEGTGKTTQLPAPSPIRQYTADFRMIVDDQAKKLIVISWGVYAPTTLFMLDYESGETVFSQSSPNTGFTGIHLDETRRNLWLSEASSVFGDGRVTRLILDPTGSVLDSKSVTLNCSSIAIDPESGDCYCVRDVSRSESLAMLVVLDQDLRETLTASIDSLQRSETASLHRYATKIISIEGDAHLLLAGEEVHNISMKTMIADTLSSTSIERWIIGHSSSEEPILLDPLSYSLYIPDPNDRNSLIHFKSIPLPHTTDELQLVSAFWDTERSVCYLLFTDRIAQFTAETGTVREVSLKSHVQNSYSSTIERIRIIGLRPDGEIMIRLPGERSTENPAYLVDWQRQQLARVLDEAPSSSNVSYCSVLDALTWAEGGYIYVGDETSSIQLPRNVGWDEETGVAVNPSSSTAVVLSQNPIGFVAVVDLATGIVKGILYVGNLDRNAVPRLRQTALWISSDYSVYRLILEGSDEGTATDWAIPYDLRRSGGSDFFGSRHLSVTTNPDILYLVRSKTGDLVSLILDSTP